MRDVSITRVCRVVTNLEQAEAFYRAIGFTREHDAGPLPHGLHESGMCLPLRLGEQRLDLRTVGVSDGSTKWRPNANDPAFQHVAIPVRDMDRAMRAVEVAGLDPISLGGPQALPAASGGVTAFKFRDPAGQPLELIHFPGGEAAERWRNAPGLFLGLDHSAMTVSDRDAAIAFFETRFGFRVTARGLNEGEEQARLDGVPDPIVDVITLVPGGAATPHLELLHYRQPRPPADLTGPSLRSATTLVLQTATPSGVVPFDLSGPDSHLLRVERPS